MENRESAVKRPLLWVIRVYQIIISPMLPAACRFQPSCSHYGYEAIQKYGVVRGGGLAIWRICRCNPFGKGGYDPVP